MEVVKRMKKVALVVGLAWLGVACGGSDIDPIAAPDAEAPAPGLDGGPKPTDPPPPDPRDASPEASLPDAGPRDAAPEDKRIDPIEVGRTWTYDVKVLGFYPACSAGTHVATAKSAAQKDGKRAITVSSLCKNAGDYEYAVEGDRVFTYVAGWRLSLDAPVAEGHTWTDGVRSYVWRSKGTKTVPAGTFSDCWSATVVASYTSYTVFCRGVGPVEWHYEDGFGNGYEAVLTAKGF